MKFLTSILQQLPEYRRLRDCAALPCSTSAAAGLTAIHKAHIIHTLCNETGNRALVAVSNEAEAQTLANDLSSMGSRALVYPLRDFTFRDIQGQSHAYEHKRLHVLSKMLRGDYSVVIACIDAASQYTIPPKALQEATLTLCSGGNLSMETAVQVLTRIGYERCEQVEGAGQFAVRGGILDFYMPDAPAPVRAEFWGDQIDTLNYFDPETQRRTEYIEELTLTPSTEVLIQDKNALALQIERHAALLRGKAAPLARQVCKRSRRPEKRPYNRF